MKTPFMVAVAGGSGCGKTTFVGKLVERLHDLEPLVIQIDHYYRDLSHLDPEARDAVNYDHPDAIEMSLLLQHLTLLSEGHEVKRPIYDFATHTRKKETVLLAPKAVVILDGIFTLCDPRLYPLFQMKLFVDVDEDVRLARRIRRDTTTRGRTTEGAIEQYLRTVKPMHQQFIEPTKVKADFVIPWMDYNDSSVALLAELIRTKALSKS